MILFLITLLKSFIRNSLYTTGIEIPKTKYEKIQFNFILNNGMVFKSADRSPTFRFEINDIYNNKIFDFESYMKRI